jgi:apolipoprotein N-acyltransferase
LKAFAARLVAFRSMRGGLVGSALLATAATALIFGLYSNVTWPWVALGWVGLVPWLAALDRLTSARAAAAAGWLMSVAFSWSVFPWFPQMVSDYGGHSRAIGALAFVVAAPLIEPQFVVFALARGAAVRATPRRAVRAIVGAGVYVGAEWAIAKLMGDTIGQGQFASTWMRQSADLFGAHGLTFLLILVNESMLAAVLAWWRRPLRGSPGGVAGVVMPLAFCAAVLCGLNGYGAARLAQLASQDGGPAIRVAIVQANIGHYDRLRAEVGSFEAVRLILETHFALSEEAVTTGDVDLVLWPETVYPTTFGAPKSEDGAAFDRAIAGFVARHGVPLVFGAFDRDALGEYNAAVVLAPSGSGRVEFEVYRKTRLFPFTEYLPAVFESATVRRWLPWAGTWRPGDGTRVLPVRTRDGRSIPVAPLICYDAVDPSLAIAAVRSGAEVLLTLSNDSWFAYPGARRLILVASAFRGIETRRPHLRATTTGISAAIDATGRLVEVVESDERGVIVATVRPAGDSATWFARWGNWLPPVAMAIAVLVLAAAAVSARERGARRP